MEGQHEPPDRVRRATAVGKQVVPRREGLVSSVLAERGEEIQERLDRKPESLHRIGESDEDRSARSAVDRAMERDLDLIDRLETLARRGRGVGDIVGAPREGVNGGKGGSPRRREEPRRDGEILVVAPNDRFAGRVCLVKRDRNFLGVGLFGGGEGLSHRTPRG